MEPDGVGDQGIGRLRGEPHQAVSCRGGAAKAVGKAGVSGPEDVGQTLEFGHFSHQGQKGRDVGQRDGPQLVGGMRKSQAGGSRIAVC